MPSAKQQLSNIKHGGGIRPNVWVLTFGPPVVEEVVAVEEVVVEEEVVAVEEEVVKEKKDYTVFTHHGTHNYTYTLPAKTEAKTDAPGKLYKLLS